MGYTHYWHQKRAFTAQEWVKIVAESKRICAKAMRAMYSGPETVLSQFQTHNENAIGAREGFAEKGAWRTFSHPEIATPAKGEAIALAGPMGDGQPEFSDEAIALNGSEAKGEDYETFRLERAPVRKSYEKPEEEIFNFCKTEYRPYDAVVVSILAAASLIAPKAIRVTSDGGDEVIRLMF